MPTHSLCYICHCNQHETRRFEVTFEKILDFSRKEDEKNETKAIGAAGGYFSREIIRFKGCKTKGKLLEEFDSVFLEGIEVEFCKV